MLRNDIRQMLEKSLCYINNFPKISCFVAGLLLKFCFSSDCCCPILLMPAFAVLLHTVRLAPKKRKAFSLGYCFGFGYFWATLYWIANAFRCVGLGNYGYIAVLALVLYISFYPALACLITKLLARTRVQMLILFSITWLLAEYIRGHLFTGFPWNLIGYASYDIPYFAQIADIVSVYGVSFLLMLIISLLTCKKTVIYAVGLCVAICSYGYYKIQENDSSISLYTTPITLVQPSIPQIDKIDTRKFRSNINKMIGLSLRRSSKLNIYKGKRLVIWSESAINFPVSENSKILKYISKAINDKNTILIIGIDRYDDKNQLYNSAYIVDANGQVVQVYDKRHLLPFGEYIPEFLQKIGLQKLTNGIINFSSGTYPRTVRIDGVSPFELVICYEIAFPGKISDSRDSKWILNITNDAWFGESDGPQQHCRMACFRAIEERKPVARCANNGITCIIDRFGRVIKYLSTNEIGNLIGYMP